MTRGSDSRIFWLLVGLAALLRATYLLEYTALPFLDAPLFDSVVYLRQAQAVRAGDLAHPTLLAMSPLYGYLLALVGDSAVVFLQLALGVAALFLIRRIVERAFDPPTALVACGLYVGYGLLLFFETKVLSETFGFFLLLCAFERYTSDGFAAGRVGPALGAGVLLGLAVLARANVLLASPFFVAAALLRWRGDEAAEARPALLFRAALLSAGLALVLGGNGLSNYARTGHFVPVIFPSRTVTATTSTEWDGSLDSVSTGASPPSAWDVVRQAEERLRERDTTSIPTIDIGGWLVGAPAKLAVTFSDIETTFQYGYYGERQEIRTLDLLPVSFGTLLLLGMVGAIALGRGRGVRALWPYAPLVLGVLLTTTLFHPSSRYRLPIVVPLLVLGAHGAVSIARMRPSRRRSMIAGAIVLACAALTYRTIAYDLRHPGLWELRVAEGEAVRGDGGAARERIGRALAVEPDCPAVRERATYVRGLLGGPPR